jgi:hypothetical protein
MSHRAEHIAGVTTHKRLGKVSHGFSYGVDYVLIDPEIEAARPGFFSRNRFNLMAVHDCDHGGPPGQGRGPTWVREALAAKGLGQHKLRLLLLTQPRFLGYVFNPVSFWLVMEDTALVAVIAEVSTPFGDRHSYFCHNPDFATITKASRIETPKSLHVSPFQDVAGKYEFSFDISLDRISIRILHRNGPEGVIATLSGSRAPMTNAGLLKASLRRPLGALRTILLIYWQALRLKLKGARYRAHPKPPNSEIT